MKRIVIGLVALLGTVGLAQVASAVSCPTPPPPGQAVATVGAPSNGFTYSCAGLTFSNFLAVDADSATATPTITLASASFNEATGYVVLDFNPDLTLPVAQDVWLYFQVSGTINGVDLLNAGSSGTSVFERVCSSTITSNICSGQGTQLAELLAFGNQSDADSFASQNGVNIYKDIAKPAGEHLTSFSQSFHVPVPEPATLLLLGSGLVGLGVWSRRKLGK